ncbi:MAG: hypothetical protein A2Z48_00625 [Actinobacteria bacterium RBG_19FT_COMBO_70_19]|nr:MAG: hypothetical protein A2Z48_00625 [Actinobacteria bacterium RBG_19FT_COMBO_70_19]
MRGTERLLELQDLDSAIGRLEHRRGQLEAGEDLADARAVMEEAESRLGEVRLALDAIAVEQRRFENEIDSMEQKAAADEKRLYDGSIANTKELDALQHEIANIKERKSRTEDELLERMERREELEARAAVEDRNVAATRARVEEVGGDALQELEEILATLSDKRAARDALTPEIDEELLELYEDLRRQKKGVGAAAIVDGVCQACHEKLSALELDRLKHTDGVKRCEYCRRIVVFA